MDTIHSYLSIGANSCRASRLGSLLPAKAIYLFLRLINLVSNSPAGKMPPPWNRARKEHRMILLLSMENHDEDGELVYKQAH